MMDANANRAREALRVMEDVARFVLNDEPLSRELKSMRHDLQAALTTLPAGWIESSRDTPGDVGTQISTASEARRTHLLDVATAAAKRLTEALRVLEETSKTLTHRPGQPAMGDASAGKPLSQRLESIRYRAYAAETELTLMLGTGRATQWRVCVLLTESLCSRPWRDVLTAVIDGGADCIQLREKDMDGGALADRTREVIELARPAGVSVINNDRLDIALATGADGVHLGTGDLSIRDARRIAGRSLLIGASTHDLDEAEQAVRAGADYCGVGAMFTTARKPGRQPVGPAYLRAFVTRYPEKPHLAIGGVTPENVHRLVEAGARGVAISGCACAADDPARVVRQLDSAVSSGQEETVRQ